MSAFTERIIETQNHTSIKSLIFQNDNIKIDLLPEIGGKIISFKSKRTNENYLLEPFEPQRFINPNFRDTFDLRYAYGFDECFPTVEPCTYNLDNKQISLPDHGELWSRPWDYDVQNDTLKLRITGKELDYIFERAIKLKGNSLIMTYT